MRAVVLLLAVMGCNSEYELGTAGEAGLQPLVEAAPAEEPVVHGPALATSPLERPVEEPRFTRPVGDRAGSSAREVWTDRSGRYRKEVFQGGEGARTPLVDFLFVVDNSVSMKKVLEQVDSAFAALAREGVFPEQARVAVTSTLPGEPVRPDTLEANLGRAHPATRKGRQLAKDPGFLRLVDQGGLNRARQVSEKHEAAYLLDGCDAWFAPTARNPQGASCLTAHTQAPLLFVRAEAGLTALGQLLHRHAQAEEPLFREGAAVNVVIVSDTHDPGLPEDAEGYAELVALRPDAAALQHLVDAQGPVSSFRIHAIAPKVGTCGERWAHIGPVYHQAAERTGGASLDVCTATDYRPLVRAIAEESGVMQRPLLTLTRPASGDVRVQVDGVDVPFHILSDRVLSLESVDARRSGAVTVIYEAPARERKRPVRRRDAAVSPKRSGAPR